MTNKYPCKSEFVWNVHIQVMLKLISFAINFQHAWVCWDMVAGGIVFEIPRLTVKCTLSLTKWIANCPDINSFQIPLKTSWTGHRSCKAKDFFVFCSRKICLELFQGFCSFVLGHLCPVHKICPNSHHNHPRHPFITWIYRECRAQNGLIL